MLMNKTRTETDWNRVLAYREGDRISYELGDGPYDPNDPDAARAWFAQADLIRRGKRGLIARCWSRLSARRLDKDRKRYTL